MIKCVIFDLDGTLVNTIDDLGLACDYLLREKGIEPNWTKDDYKSFVGNGARLLVERAFSGKLSEEELDEQYELFKIKYNEIKNDHAYAYDGISEVLDVLKKNGVKLAVCTNKPDLAAKGMVTSIFGESMFDMIVGAVDGIPKKPNPLGAEKILKELNVSAKECIWVGDSSVDVETARNLGCDCIAVTWGFRDYNHLFSAEPSQIIDEPKKILKNFAEKC